MGEWTEFTKCKCPNNKSCVTKDSGELCNKRRVKPVAKAGKNGGKIDCKKVVDRQDCTSFCKYMHSINYLLQTDNNICF